MACITWLATPLVMTTTQLTRVIRYEVSAPSVADRNTEPQPLRMNWVVVTGKNGSRGLRMQWVAVEDC